MRLVLFCLLFAGCAFQRGRIITPQGTVVGVKDAGKPAQIATVDDRGTLEIPAGTKMTVTKTEAVPATAQAPAKPAQEVTSYDFSQPTRFEQVKVAVNADTGTVDTSIAKHRIDVEENRWLLWASLACIPLAALFFYLHYPTPAFYAIASAVVFFVAWQIAGLPEWIKFLGFGGIIAGVVMWRAHERGLRTGAAAPEAAEPVIPKTGVPIA